MKHIPNTFTRFNSFRLNVTLSIVRTFSQTIYGRTLSQTNDIALKTS
jgi:hypothetical protein